MGCPFKLRKKQASGRREKSPSVCRQPLLQKMLPPRLWKHRLSPGAGVALQTQAESVCSGLQLRQGKVISLRLWFICSLAWSSKAGLHLDTSNPWVVIAGFHCGAAPEGGNIELGKDVFPLPGCMASLKNNKCQSFQQDKLNDLERKMSQIKSWTKRSFSPNKKC